MTGNITITLTALDAGLVATMAAGLIARRRAQGQDTAALERILAAVREGERQERVRRWRERER